MAGVPTHEFAGLVLFAESASVYLFYHASNVFIFTKWTQHFSYFLFAGEERERNIHFLSTWASPVRTKLADVEGFRINWACLVPARITIYCLVTADLALPLPSPRLLVRNSIFLGFEGKCNPELHLMLNPIHRKNHAKSLKWSTLKQMNLLSDVKMM